MFYTNPTLVAAAKSVGWQAHADPHETARGAAAGQRTPVPDNASSDVEEVVPSARALDIAMPLRSLPPYAGAHEAACTATCTGVLTDPAAAAVRQSSQHAGGGGRGGGEGVGGALGAARDPLKSRFYQSALRSAERARTEVLVFRNPQAVQSCLNPAALNPKPQTPKRRYSYPATAVAVRDPQSYIRARSSMSSCAHHSCQRRARGRSAKALQALLPPTCSLYSSRTPNP